MILQRSFTVSTRGRDTYDMTNRVQAIVRESGIRLGVVNIFVHHTSASLMLCENADPAVRRDLEAFMARLAPDGAPWLEHDDEGPDDMPAHIRTVLAGNSLVVPVTDGRCALGTWQGLYLWEHRRAGHSRRVTVTVQGENPARED
ncbi:MAG: secondary thiamine-phosphate synthase enzyme YjbQ [Candidatus Competibacteraceae bacterium]